MTNVQLAAAQRMQAAFTRQDREKMHSLLNLRQQSTKNISIWSSYVWSHYCWNGVGHLHLLSRGYWSCTDTWPWCLRPSVRNSLNTLRRLPAPFFFSVLFILRMTSRVTFDFTIVSTPVSGISSVMPLNFSFSTASVLKKTRDRVKEIHRLTSMGLPT